LAASAKVSSANATSESVRKAETTLFEETFDGLDAGPSYLVLSEDFVQAGFQLTVLTTTALKMPKEAR
jgi:hypothetical protein